MAESPHDGSSESPKDSLVDKIKSSRRSCGKAKSTDGTTDGTGTTSGRGIVATGNNAMITKVMTVIGSPGSKNNNVSNSAAA